MNRLLVVLAAVLLAAAPRPAVGARLTLLHTNDTHGHLQPFSYPEGVTGNSAIDAMPLRRDLGGIARRATLAARIKAECRAQGVTALLIDAGDFLDGSPFSTEYRGRADLNAMKAAGYDYGTLGNHEFNVTPEELRGLLRTAADTAAAPLPLLCANVLERDGRLLTLPYALRTIDSLRVGIFGLVTEEAAGYPAARAAFEVLPVEATARTISTALRRLGADVVILISHCGEDVDRKLVSAAPQIDVIVGGHSHSRLPSGEYFRPFAASPADSNGTVLLQAHQWGGELGRCDLDFRWDARGRWTLAAHEASLLPVTAALPEDSATAAVVQEYWAPISGTYGEVVGEAAADFTSRRRPDGGYDLANYNLVADATRETFGVDFDLENLGGVRAPLVRGPITLADLVTADPFDNTVVTFTVTGAQLRRILERERPAVSGIVYRVEQQRLVHATVGGAPLDDAREYRGAANSYFARTALRDLQVQDTGRRRLDVIREYVRKQGTIQPAYDGRRVVLGGRGED